MKIKLNYTKGFELLQKRLMCQPMTFKNTTKENQLTIELDRESGLKDLKSHLTDFVTEETFRQTITAHMKETGYADEFIKGYLSKSLINEAIKLHWRKNVETKLSTLVEESYKTNKEIDLDVLLNFGLHKEKELIRQFAEVCDEEMEEELINYVLEPFFDKKEEATQINLGVSTILIQNKNNDLMFLLEHERALDITEYRELIFPEKQQKIYKSDTDIMNELRNIAIIILIAKLYSIETYVIPNEKLLKKSNYYLTKYGIPTQVKANN